MVSAIQTLRQIMTPDNYDPAQTPKLLEAILVHAGALSQPTNPMDEELKAQVQEKLSSCVTPNKPKTMRERKVCSTCQRTAEEASVDKLMVCGRCKGASYCSVHCQTIDWKLGHKTTCAAPK
jgi:hypothetical protein